MHSHACTLLIPLLVSAHCLASAHCSAAESPFLVDMPQNSDQRCVGICGVAEALLEGKPQPGKLTNIDELARTVYSHFTTDVPINYPERIMLKGKGVAIDSPAVLAALSNRVAELYKADFHRLSNSPAGVRQLLEAQGKVIKTRGELDELLAADPDKTVFVCCFGQRTFPDRTVKDTNHAVLIQAAKNHEYVVYDPNDPGAAIPCTLAESPDGLMATWRCQYRDQQVETTQNYLMVPQQRYFKTLRAPVPERYSLIRQSRPGALAPPAKCNCEK